MTALLVTDSKYEFVPPHEGEFWPRLLGRITPWHLRRGYGIERIEVRGAEVLQRLCREGHGVLLAPNHCRMTDALVLQSLANEARQPFYLMASSHLFRGRRWMAWMLRRMGAFSVYREGLDRQAIQKAVDILAAGRRPLVIFPEGALSQANDRLQALQEGASFIARAAAAKLRKSEQPRDAARRVYALPVAIRYTFQGDIDATAGQLLGRIEERLSWKPRTDSGLVERVLRVGEALLSLKECEFLGAPQPGPLHVRVERLIDGLLAPLETEWLGGRRERTAILRVKELRRAILPDMIEGRLSPEESERRWGQLKAAELAQSLSLYPAEYVVSRPTVDRILETVERFAEHLIGDETPHGPMHVVVQVGTPIEVNAKRDRTAAIDPLLSGIEQGLSGLLAATADASRVYQGGCS
ncbi:MAG: 1-acyl-sn-glycerol-3-phosphate acyltransferase [Pirellulales bacterium]